MQKHQNQAPRKITLKRLHDLVNLLYKELLHLQNCLFVSQIEQNRTLAKSFEALNHCCDNHNQQTQASNEEILDKANTYFTYSAKNYCSFNLLNK